MVNFLYLQFERVVVNIDEMRSFGSLAALKLYFVYN